MTVWELPSAQDQQADHYYDAAEEYYEEDYYDDQQSGYGNSYGAPSKPSYQPTTSFGNAERSAPKIPSALTDPAKRFLPDEEVKRKDAREYSFHFFFQTPLTPYPQRSLHFYAFHCC